MSRAYRYCPPFVSVCLMLALTAAVPAWATSVGGHVTTDTTWGLAGSPYIITTNVYVDAGAELTVEPGVSVKFQPGLYMVVDGTLTAVGTAGSPITFTSNADTPAAGDWRHIHFRTTESSASVLQYCTISYGGSTDTGAIFCERTTTYGSGDPSIRNTTIRRSGTHGIVVSGAAPTIGPCTIRDCTYPVYLTGYTASPVFREGNAFTGNAINSIVVDDGTWYDATWSKADHPYYIATGITVTSGHTLTLKPGVRLEFGPAAKLLSHGVVNAIGTAANPIVFTSAKVTPGPSDWDSLWFDDDAGSDSVLSYCEVRYAGGAGHGAIYVDDASGPANITISDTLVSDSGGVGILCEDTRPTIQSCVIQDCTTYPIFLRPSASPFYPVPNTFAGNGTDAVGIGGTSWSTATWRKAGPYPLVVPQDVTIASGSTLTIKPRTTVKLAPGVGILLNGVLEAVGGNTPGQHITFTSTADSPVPGAWDSIKLYGSGATNSVLEYCDLLFGGGGGQGALVCLGTTTPITLTVSHCTIADSSANGIYCNEAAPAIGGCTIARCATRPIHLEPTSSPTYPLSNTYTDNTNQTIGVAGGGWATATWRKAGLPYEVLGDLLISSGQTLTILQGNTVRLRQNVGIDVSGALVAIGTPTARITFTSWVSGTPQKGDWEHIDIYGAGSSASQLVNCNIRYGGKTGTAPVPVVRCSGSLGGGSPIIRDSTIEKAGGDGIWLTNGASPRLENLLIQDNDAVGVHVDTSTSVMVGCRVKNNKVGVRVDAGGTPNLGNLGNGSSDDDGDNTFVGNTDYDVANYSTNLIKAENNHWVSSDPDVIAQHIWDQSDNPAVGVVDFQPFQGPAALMVPAGSAQIVAVTAQANGLGGATVSFALSAPATVEAAVVNMAGRPVRQICAPRAMDAGSQALVWDGRTAAGVVAPGGSYLVRLTARNQNGSQAQALAVLRLTR